MVHPIFDRTCSLDVDRVEFVIEVVDLRVKHQVGFIVYCGCGYCEEVSVAEHHLTEASAEGANLGTYVF